MLGFTVVTEACVVSLWVCVRQMWWLRLASSVVQSNRKDIEVLTTVELNSAGEGGGAIGARHILRFIR